jgi:glucose-6-phosphate 1-dehydrogenase
MPEPSPTAPTIFVVFGATGDLMERKIAPSLYHLWEKHRLPERFRIVGFARRPFPDDVFREMMCAAIRGHHAAGADEDDIHEFAKAITYSQGHFDEPEAYARLAEELLAIDDEWGVCANKLFYLAVPPDNYRVIFEQLASSGLTATCPVSSAEGGWTRVIVEKPFGRDAHTAQDLDELLGTLFEERQIYRIDHYLAKEMLQGIMSFRFSNNLFEPSWNNRAIERIDIDLLETLGAEDRGGFYDPIGALRDVGQNHLLQMLALITMDQPRSMDADAIRASRVRALEALCPPAVEDVGRCTYRAQYDGYRSIEGVAPESTTETFFKVVTRLDSVRWRGVPVVMRGGKRLADVRKQIVVSFKHPQPCLCDGVEHVENTVTFKMEPADSITIGFWTKKPGFDDVLEPRDFNFLLYEKEEKTQYVEEYSRLLVDAIAGDQTLFVSTDEVKAMWAFIDPIVRGWRDGLAPLDTYRPDTAEPLRASDRLCADGPIADTLRREIGVAGLGRMGAGIARNLLDHRWRVVGFNRHPNVADGMAPDGLLPAHTLADLVAGLEPPRTVWVMVPAGQAVDDLLFGDGGLAGLLSAGDTVIEGGNSRYSDDAPRAERLAAAGIRFVDVGVSGGPSGARDGACLMVGGARADFERLLPLWRDLSTQDGFRHFEGVGAGHFVKMVHNGIEYGMMQAIAEGFTVLRESPYPLDLRDVAAIYDRGSVIESRLVAWLEEALRVHGPELADVSGTVGYTGEGGWTVDAARELGVDVRVIADALAFRLESQDHPDWTGRVLSALRQQFGQHSVSS